VRRSSEGKQHGGSAFSRTDGASGGPAPPAAAPEGSSWGGRSEDSSGSAAEAPAAVGGAGAGDGAPGALTPAEVLHELLGPLYVDTSLLTMGGLRPHCWRRQGLGV
jgi:hypothetical protein